MINIEHDVIIVKSTYVLYNSMSKSKLFVHIVHVVKT